MSGYTPAFHRIFTGELSGRWPAAPVYVSLISLASPDGLVEQIHRAIVGATGWPEPLLREGIAELEKAGLIQRLHDHIDWGWSITNFRDVLPGARRLSWSEWAVLRSEIFDRDDYTCAYCQNRGGKLECDHVVPISRGGTNDPSNLVTACFSCNRKKRDKSLAEWKRA